MSGFRPLFTEDAPAFEPLQPEGAEQHVGAPPSSFKPLLGARVMTRPTPPPVAPEVKDEPAPDAESDPSLASDPSLDSVGDAGVSSHRAGEGADGSRRRGAGDPSNVELFVRGRLLEQIEDPRLCQQALDEREIGFLVLGDVLVRRILLGQQPTRGDPVQAQHPLDDGHDAASLEDVAVACEAHQERAWHQIDAHAPDVHVARQMCDVRDLRGDPVKDAVFVAFGDLQPRVGTEQALELVVTEFGRRFDLERIRCAHFLAAACLLDLERVVGVGDDQSKCQSLEHESASLHPENGGCKVRLL